ncbi:hypothetical protein EVAR_41506_1 [Eumeta japonica]|uniref:Uncharacterized protein n=1 Tax=Eumeta variegata TaxID=151549 RepID=A0A4C1X6F1_EUMVA|nr:hypothetical protein EVAR_41506_1 [Eumeta japonica]
MTIVGSPRRALGLRKGLEALEASPSEMQIPKSLVARISSWSSGDARRLKTAIARKCYTRRHKTCAGVFDRARHVRAHLFINYGGDLNFSVCRPPVASRNGAATHTGGRRRTEPGVFLLHVTIYFRLSVLKVSGGLEVS